MLQRLRAAWLSRTLPVVFIATGLALIGPHLLAQQPEPSPTSSADGTGNPDTPSPQVPNTDPSNKGAAEQLRLAQQQGKAETAVVDWVLANSGPLKGDVRAGAMRIAFTITPAEGWWDKAGGGKLAWHDPPEDSVHLRIFVLDGIDGRQIPGLSLHATITDANGNEQSVPTDFGWYPLINAYGGNVLIEADSTYTLRVTVDTPQPAFAGGHFEHTTVAEFPPEQIVQDSVTHIPLATAIAYSNEAELLKPCNAAVSAAITALWKQSAAGAEKADGDYFVGYSLDYSAAAVQIAGSKLRFKNLMEFTGKDDVRLNVLPRDSRTGRLIPGLKLQASLIAADGKLYGPGDLPLSWHRWLTQYGRNARIARKGFYKLRVHFDAPGFRRWGLQSNRFATPTDVEFKNVTLTPEQRD